MCWESVNYKKCFINAAAAVARSAAMLVKTATTMKKGGREGGTEGGGRGCVGGSILY